MKIIDVQLSEIFGNTIYFWKIYNPSHYATYSSGSWQTTINPSLSVTIKLCCYSKDPMD